MEATEPIGELISTGQAARLLGSSRQHVVDLCKRDVLRFIRVGAHRRVYRSDVEQIIFGGLTRDEERSLWLHRAIAGQLVLAPEAVLHRTRINIDRLLQLHGDDPAGRCVARWQALIDSGLDPLLDTLTSLSRQAIELRNNSPFAGVLSDADRDACLAAFREHWRREHAA